MIGFAGIEKKRRTQLAEVLGQTGPAVTVADAARILELPRMQTAKLMTRWAEQGWLSRVRRGLYAPVPLEARTAMDTISDPWIIAQHLCDPCYIGGWSAAGHWELTEQIFKTVVVMTTQAVNTRKLTVQSTDYWIKTVAPKRFFGMNTVWRDTVPIRVADPSKAIIDMLDDPAIGGGIRLVTTMLDAYLASPHKNLELLVAYARRMRNGAIRKRLGFLLERAQINDEAVLKRLRRQLTAGNAKLDPALPAEQLMTRWRLWVPANWEHQPHD